MRPCSRAISPTLVSPFTARSVSIAPPSSTTSPVVLGAFATRGIADNEGMIADNEAGSSSNAERRAAEPPSEAIHDRRNDHIVPSSTLLVQISLEVVEKGHRRKRAQLPAGARRMLRAEDVELRTRTAVVCRCLALVRARRPTDQ